MLISSPNGKLIDSFSHTPINHRDAEKHRDKLSRAIAPQIHQCLSLSQAAAAHKLLESGKVSGKLVLNP
ncbi:MAG: zinc-binding dehydrogenase [Cyanobacteria bacterium P01_E01_bin.42]